MKDEKRRVEMLQNGEVDLTKLHKALADFEKALDAVFTTPPKDSPPSTPTRAVWAHPSTIFVDITRGKEGLLYATSPQVPGLLVAKPTREEVFAALPQAIGELYSLMVTVKDRGE